MMDDQNESFGTHSFEFACSTLPFDAEAYRILSRQGNHLDELLSGTVLPRTRREEYFIRCVREGADYDSHQCVEADAWGQLEERRRFEAEHPPPSPNRTWIREWELREGMILLLDDSSAVLLSTPKREVQIENMEMKYRNRPDLPWHLGKLQEEGWWRLVTSLQTRKQSERFMTKDEVFEVADGMNREMNFLWWNGPDDEMLVQDPDTMNTFFIPPSRVSWDFLSVPVHTESQIRVQWWGGEPLWAWGAV